MVIWDYPIDYHNYIIPVANMPVVTENMRYYVKHGATGVFQQAQNMHTYGVDRSLMRSWVCSMSNFSFGVLSFRNTIGSFPDTGIEHRGIF